MIVGAALALGAIVLFALPAIFAGWLAGWIVEQLALRKRHDRHHR